MTGSFSYNHIISKLEIKGVCLEEFVLSAYVPLTWLERDYSKM